MADPDFRARIRLIVALEEVQLAARALGLDAAAVGALHAPLEMRVDAWCYRIERAATAWTRVTASPLFRRARTGRAAA